MKLLTFTYKKADGSTSQRTVLPISEPAKLLSGLDLSSLSKVEILEYATTYNALKNDFDTKMAALASRYNLSQSFRQFKADGISNFQTEYI